ncbi:MAG: Uncharacterized protein G01um101493_361, partial [Microgenomates group bacterium Gr01-1014_93]
MAYSKEVVKVAQKLGYKWIVIDELGFPSSRTYIPDRIYEIDGLKDFSVFFRERGLSFVVLSAQLGTMSSIIRYLGDRLQRNDYAITAMDGETFGHHRPGMEKFLFDLLSDERIDTVMLSDLPGDFPNLETVDPRPSTWAVTEQDMERGEPYARWKRSDNPIQLKQWQLTELAISVAHRTPDNVDIRAALDRALHSDQYWWASARPWWSLEMIERGAFE